MSWVQIDLERFRTEAKGRRKARKQLFQKLRKAKPSHLDNLLHRANTVAFERINCLDCANCCKTTGPLFTPADIDRIAKHFRLSSADFMERYLRVDEDKDWVLQSLPCPFLGGDNYCSIYEVRPKACQTYPHTHQNGQAKLLHLLQANASICPAVDDMLDQVEKEM